MGRLRSAIDSLLPLHAHTLAQGRLYVSLTRVWGGENLLLSNFHSRDELIKVLLASCFIPVYAGLKPVEHMGRGTGRRVAAGCSVAWCVCESRQPGCHSLHAQPDACAAGTVPARPADAGGDVQQGDD
ncbi:patatin-like phospholipase domain-containing protein 4 isoform X2 [Mus pahari]|uniref:patatin-like phospholipase domain-containing protein 4 isoform X2 n=1 Tax=Mus pahari TaxID=10093 RepID=UPI0011149568|nr:patatin-like phospholipase domain-containing protein 4 isoform X2 [Mus pahari]